MTYYKDVYLKRLNRYGFDYKTRVQTQREKEFDNYLLKSAYRIDFEYNGELVPATFEKRKQDETEVLYYLLTKLDVQLDNGTMLQIPDGHGGFRPWLVWYFEDMQTSGYNRYTMLKMTHIIKWVDPEKETHYDYGYFYGQEDNMLKAEIKSRSRMNTVYMEDLKLSFVVMPRNANLKRNSLIQLGNADDPFYEEYIITGQDLQSTPGVTYLSVDPTYKHDLTEAPKQSEDDDETAFFWLNGGEKL